MKALDVPVKVSVNRDQFEPYSKVFSAAGLITDDTSLPVKGPLLGVLSSHLAFPAEDLFCLACDMPLMDISVLKELHDLYRRQHPADAFVFTNEGEAEPLCGIYTAKGLSKVLAMLRSGQLPRYSMKFMLEQLEKKTMAATEEQKKYFRNINAHAELNGL
jgi:molybdopterin-guanine dinucleotide biosynthesis protein A